MAECVNGEVCDDPNQVLPKKVPAGKQVGADGTLIDCPLGSYSAEGSTVGCTQCPAGSFCPDPKHPPLVCPAGMYTSMEGQSDCVICPAGSICPQISGT